MNLELRPWFRCRHRSRLLNLPCFRPWTYNGWCGHHNWTCGDAHVPDVNRCPGSKKETA